MVDFANYLNVVVQAGILTCSDNAAAQGVCYLDTLNETGTFEVWVARTGETLRLKESQFTAA